MKNEFLLRNDITFLNHGSFGACPKKVFEKYQQYQKDFESQPVEYFARKSANMIEKARKDLAEYIGTEKENLVFVKNATTAVNIFAKSINLKIGDEVLASNHEYGALNRMWEIMSKDKGFTYKKSTVKLPVSDKKTFINDFISDISEKTKVIFLSHISAPSAIIFPIEEICEYAKSKNIITIIDGAHAPGQIPLYLDKLQADFYTGNCHKWLLAPKGAAFMFAKPEMQKILKPLIISWGELGEQKTDSAFVSEFQSQATFDFSAYLAVSDSINFLKENNWDNVIKRNKELLIYAKEKLSELIKTEPIITNNDFLGLMYAHQLPENIDALKLKTDLWEKYKIEIPVTFNEKMKFIRISIQIYNDKKDIDFLIKSISELIN
jgi:isopenicillin-N epimerase